jgi:hypothetical protein
MKQICTLKVGQRFVYDGQTGTLQYVSPCRVLVQFDGSIEQKITSRCKTCCGRQLIDGAPCLRCEGTGQITRRFSRRLKPQSWPREVPVEPLIERAQAGAA